MLNKMRRLSNTWCVYDALGKGAAEACMFRTLTYLWASDTSLRLMFLVCSRRGFLSCSLHESVLDAGIAAPSLVFKPTPCA